MEDQDIILGLQRAGVPKRYQDPKSSLKDNGEVGAKLLDWLGSGGSRGFSRAGALLEILDVDVQSEAVFYKLAKALFLRRCPVLCLDAATLRPPFTDELWDKVREYGVLMVDGLITRDRIALTPSETDSLEWFLIKWVGNGHSLVLLNEVSIFSDGKESNPFSRRLKNRLRDRLILTV